MRQKALEMYMTLAYSLRSLTRPWLERGSTDQRRSAMSFTRLTAIPAALCLAFATTASAQVMDDLNGIWTMNLDGQNVQNGRVMTESYHGHWIRQLPDGKPVELG